MKFDQYEIKARIIPAIITTMLPLYLFNYFLVHQELQKLFIALSEWKVISGITTYLILLYLVVEINRTLSKFLLEKFYFNGKKKLPTTVLLLFSNSEFSDSFKERIREKIVKDFNVRLLGKGEEKESKETARKLISEGVAHIREKMRGDSFIKQANIRYGFFRNLIGGCIIGLLLSVTNIGYIILSSEINWGLMVHIVLSAIYLLLLIASKWLIEAHGKSYARTLLENYDCG